MIKEIYLVRHGQTDYNLKQIVQGRGVNSSLNETGKAQAAAFFNAYGSFDFDVLYTSKLRRTHQTMDDFIRKGLHHIETPALDEIDWGIYEGIAHDPQLHKRYLDIIQKWREGYLKIKIDGGESAFDLAERQKPWIDEIKRSKHQKILVCSHGRSIRALLCSMTEKSIAQMDEFPHSNTCLYKLLLNGNDQFKIEIFNNTDHLK